jgi:hypothetical protein
MVSTSKREFELDTTLRFQQHISSHPNNRIGIVRYFLSRLDLEFSLNSIPGINSVHPNTGYFFNVIRDPIKKKEQRGEVRFWG